MTPRDEVFVALVCALVVLVGISIAIYLQYRTFAQTNDSLASNMFGNISNYMISGFERGIEQNALATFQEKNIGCASEDFLTR